MSDDAAEACEPTTYEDIKRLAAQLGRPASTLVALAPSNDPFYVTESRQALAQWFKTQVWDRLVVEGDKVHVRRLHYASHTKTRSRTGRKSSARRWPPGSSASSMQAGSSTVARCSTRLPTRC